VVWQKQIFREVNYLATDSLTDHSSTGGRVLSEKLLLGSFCRAQLHYRNKNRRRALNDTASALELARF
jgi:hypothetical protein